MEAWLKNKNVRIALVILAGVLVAYLAIGSWLSKVHTTEQYIHEAWGTLQYNCDLRVQLVGRFEQLVQTYTPQAQPLLKQLAQSVAEVKGVPVQEKILTDSKALQQFTHSQQRLATALAKMDQHVQDNPILAQNRQFLLLQMELQGVENQIRFAQENLNLQISYLNYYISGFPRGWANTIFLQRQPMHPIVIATPIPKEK